MVEFSVSGVETYWWLPIVVAFSISTFTSMAGVTGAFLLLPFQVSVLGFTAPGVTPTNLLFNVVAVPLGMMRYVRQRRVAWPLLWLLLSGLLPGLLAGIWVRIRWLPDPTHFKVVVALVLAYLAVRLLADLRRRTATEAPPAGSLHVQRIGSSRKETILAFQQQSYRVNHFQVVLFSLVVGLVGGVYGIGGGALVSPVLVTLFRLPIHAVAGATLLATFVTSLIGVLLFQFLGPLLAATGQAVQPDWLLGCLFGLGGAIGIFTGSYLQARFKPKWIKCVLVVCLVVVIAKYLMEVI